MTIENIDRLRCKLGELWGRIANIKPEQIKRILKSVGRKLIKSRSPHPMYESSLEGRPNFSIPGHPGNIDKGWAKHIIRELDADLNELERLELLRIKSLKGGNGHA